VAANAVSRADRANDPEERPLSERCLSQGSLAPVSTPNVLSPRLFVQTRDHLVIQSEYGDDVRIIPFARRHKAGPPSPMGDSIARWDGDTLVVETIGSPARAVTETKDPCLEPARRDLGNTRCDSVQERPATVLRCAQDGE